MTRRWVAKAFEKWENLFWFLFWECWRATWGFWGVKWINMWGIIISLFEACRMGYSIDGYMIRRNVWYSFPLVAVAKETSFLVNLSTFHFWKTIRHLTKEPTVCLSIYLNIHPSIHQLSIIYFSLYYSPYKEEVLFYFYYVYFKLLCKI